LANLVLYTNRQRWTVFITRHMHKACLDSTDS
jgi:hypothetical protein